MPAESFFKRSLQIAGVVAAYWVISLTMVFLNKFLMSSPEIKLNAPVFITWYQCIVAVVCCWALGEFGKANQKFSMFPPFEMKMDIATRVLPLSFVFVMMILFNNLCLKYVEVSFYQVARSLTLVFNVVFTYVILHVTTSPKALLCCFTVLAGFFFGVSEEVNLSLVGVGFGLASSVFVALNSIYVKKVFPVVDGDQWKLTLYNNINGSFLFLPFILINGELTEIMEFDGLTSPYFWGMMTLGGLCGFAIAIATVSQIKATSPLTHTISSTAKACAQTILAIFVYQNPVTNGGIISVLIVLGGSLAYTMVRRGEMKVADAAKANGGGDAVQVEVEEVKKDGQ
eukprot:TRINITY_DN14757_c0_g1_i1.p1 TRINITY_DN14757_c0_g1~~TRINITY_DN14757_c0_g1_i1.p1  ORF type:complete len:342 (-),score=99.69 TRINITY_DN14757_c0_g1_i1:153-1178(-)